MEKMFTGGHGLAQTQTDPLQFSLSLCARLCECGQMCGNGRMSLDVRALVVIIV